MTPTQRTLRELRGLGRMCGVVERFIPNVVKISEEKSHGIRKDLFGFIDIISLDRERGIVGIQSCGQDFAGHLRKILEEKSDECAEWLMCGGKVELWGWRKIKLKRGGKAMRWKPRIREIVLADFEEDIFR